MIGAKPVRLLVIDDEQGFRDLLAFELGGLGFEVVTAANGEEGVRRARELEFAVAVCDLTMPGRDGFATAAEIRRSSPRTQVVLITGHATEDAPRRCREAGIAAHLLKPFSLDEIARVVREAAGLGGVGPAPYEGA